MYLTEHYAAGILPVAYHENVPLLLVGRDVRDGTWSDFGGKAERIDKGSVFSTAAREFSEETYGQVLSHRAIRNMLGPGRCLMVRSKTQNGFPYIMFIVQIPYITHLRSSVAKFINFLRMKNLGKVCIEKTDMMWTTIHALQTKMNKRSVFAATLAANAEIFRELASTNPHTWAELCEKHAHDFEAK
jgi:hypothetical protein